MRARTSVKYYSFPPASPPPLPSPIPGEGVYGSLLHEQRRALHAQIVDVMETLYAERLREHIEPLAHHALQGEVWDKALCYYREAGATAAMRSAYREAVACLEQALGALQHLPASRDLIEQAIDLRFDLRNALFALGDHGPILEHLRQAETLAQALGDQRRLARVLSYMTRHLGPLAGFDCSITLGERALATPVNFAYCAANLFPIQTI